MNSRSGRCSRRPPNCRTTCSRRCTRCSARRAGGAPGATRSPSRRSRSSRPRASPCPPPSAASAQAACCPPVRRPATYFLPDPPGGADQGRARPPQPWPVPLVGAAVIAARRAIPATARLGRARTDRARRLQEGGEPVRRRGVQPGDRALAADCPHARERRVRERGRRLDRTSALRRQRPVRVLPARAAGEARTRALPAARRALRPGHEHLVGHLAAEADGRAQPHGGGLDRAGCGPGRRQHPRQARRRRLQPGNRPLADDHPGALCRPPARRGRDRRHAGPADPVVTVVQVHPAVGDQRGGRLRHRCAGAWPERPVAHRHRQLAAAPGRGRPGLLRWHHPDPARSDLVRRLQSPELHLPGRTNQPPYPHQDHDSRPARWPSTPASNQASGSGTAAPPLPPTPAPPTAPPPKS